MDALNTKLPCDRGEMRRRIRDARHGGPAGSFALGAIINRAVSRLAVAEAFVAFGIGNGFPLLAAMSGNPDKRCIGVDDFNQFTAGNDKENRTAFLRRFDGLRTERHRLVSADGGADLTELGQPPIGVCFFGESSQADLRERLERCEPHLAENAYLLVNRSDRPEVLRAALAFVNASNNQYRILLDQRASHNASLTLGGGVLLFQLLGRNVAAPAVSRRPATPALIPAA